MNQRIFVTKKSDMDMTLFACFNRFNRHKKNIQWQCEADASVRVARFLCKWPSKIVGAIAKLRVISKLLLMSIGL